MPLTNVEKNARHRARVKAKLARLAVLEEVLREIATGYAVDAPIIARNALNHTTEAREEGA